MRFGWVAAIVLVAMPVNAHAMSVREFLAKVSGLKAKGILAIGSPDIALLKTEMSGVSAAFKADLEASRKAGKPIACPPTGGKMSQSELMSAFEAIPPAQRGMSVKAAFYGIVRKRYPCPA